MVVILSKYVFLAFTGLLNLRGSDIELNPVFYSYVIVSNDEVRYDVLFTNYGLTEFINIYIYVAFILMQKK